MGGDSVGQVRLRHLQITRCTGSTRDQMRKGAHRTGRGLFLSPLKKKRERERVLNWRHDCTRIISALNRAEFINDQISYVEV